MARKILVETHYTFTPSTKTLVIPKAIPRERLLLITNVTQNQVIYNFSDPSLNATSYVSLEANGVETTTIVFAYNTAAMLSTDKISITLDEVDESFTPSETMLDPTNKLRVTQPQALIDTDFEYGTQISKWENLALYNNKPFAYASPTPIANIGSITYGLGTNVVTVSLTSGVGPNNGDPISVHGNFVVESGGGTNTFTYTASSKNSQANLTNILDTNKTAIYRATVFSGARIGFIPALTYSTNRINVTTTVDHGLAIGNEIVVKGSTATTNPPNGNFVVATVLSPTQFVYYANNVPTGTLGGPTEIYVRPQGVFLHRPADGGVIFGTQAGSNYGEAYRQTRRYFRYQSGKGIQMSSGTILKPYAGIDSITSLGYNRFSYTALSTPSSTIATGNVFASIEAWYGCQNRLGMFDEQNGVFFEYDGTKLYAVRRSSTTQLSGRINVTNGSDVVVQSLSEQPTYFSKQLIPGDTIVIRGQSYRITSITNDIEMNISPAYRGATASLCIYSKTIDTRVPQDQFNMDKADGTGPSQYTMDLSKMQMFYIDYTWYGAGFIRWGVRGPKGNIIYLHRMQNNNVNTEAYMRSGNLPGRYSSTTNPPFTSLTDTVLTTGTSLPVKDTSRFPSSGTLVVRNTTQVEYVNYSGKTFPSSGTLVVRNTTQVEYVNYSGKTTTSFTGLTRAKLGAQNVAITIGSGQNRGNITLGADTAKIQVGMRVVGSEYPDETFVSAINYDTGAITFSQPVAAANSAFSAIPMGSDVPLQFTYDAQSPACVELAFPTFAATISHWGTSVIMDGQYDEDKSLIFTYGQRTATSVPSGATRALLSIRVAPSADNGIAANFGAREIVNRMQLAMRALDVSVSSGSTILVQAILNGTPSQSLTWTNAVGNVTGAVNSSLAQIADYSGQSSTVSGGEVTGGFFTTGTNSVDLSTLRDLGNSILGGGGTVTTSGIYPDGPDVLTITATNLGGSTASVYSRLSWTEASA